MNLDLFKNLLRKYIFLLKDDREVEIVYEEYERMSRENISKKIKEEGTNIESFWKNLYKLNSKNKCVIFIIKLLCLPRSNACVERIFSSLDLIQTDIRNKIDLETVQSIIHTKEFLKYNQVHAYNMPITKYMLENFKNYTK